MNKRVAVIAVVAIFALASAALRGCWDPTKPIPWVSGSSASSTYLTPQPATK